MASKRSREVAREGGGAHRRVIGRGRPHAANTGGSARIRRLLLSASAMHALLCVPAFSEDIRRQEPRMVRVQEVTLTRRQPSVAYSGTVGPRVMADLSFRVPGKIVARPVNVGDRVVANQVLAHLDPTTLQLEVEISRNEVAAAEAEAANASAAFARYDKMGRASSAFVESEYGSRRAAMRATEARLDRSRRQLQMALVQRQYATIRADADGVVTASPVEAGQVVAAGQKILSLAHGADIEIAVNVPENRLDEIRAAEDVEIVLMSAPGRPLHGRVREIGALADAASRTFTVKVALPESENPRLALGTTATARFVGPPAEPCVVLPSTVLTSIAGAPAVWVLDETSHRAALTPVRIAAFKGDGTVELGAGLAPGQLVVTAGADLIDRDLPLTAWRGPNR